MQSLDGQNGAGDGQIGFARNEARAAEVGAGTDALEDGGECNEARAGVCSVEAIGLK